MRGTLSGWRTPSDRPIAFPPYSVDANGIMQVSASDKASGRTGRITITNDKGRLSAKDIDRLVQEAEKYKAEDEKQRSRIQAREGGGGGGHEDQEGGPVPACFSQLLFDVLPTHRPTRPPPTPRPARRATTSSRTPTPCATRCATRRLRPSCRRLTSRRSRRLWTPPSTGWRPTTWPRRRSSTTTRPSWRASARRSWCVKGKNTKRARPILCVPVVLPRALTLPAQTEQAPPERRRRRPQHAGAAAVGGAQGGGGGLSGRLLSVCAVRRGVHWGSGAEGWGLIGRRRRRRDDNGRQPVCV